MTERERPPLDWITTVPSSSAGYLYVVYTNLLFYYSKKGKNYFIRLTIIRKNSVLFWPQRNNHQWDHIYLLWYFFHYIITCNISVKIFFSVFYFFKLDLDTVYLFWNFRPVTYQTSLFDDGYGYFFSLFFSWGRDSRGEGDEVIVVFTFIAIKFLVYIRNYHFTYCVF